MIIKVNELTESLNKKYSLAEANEVTKCCLCGKPIKGYGNNPAPLDETPGAKCCDACNKDVIKARMSNLKMESVEEESSEDLTEELVDIENFLEPSNYIVESKENLEESFNNEPVFKELPDRPTKGRKGSPEYDANTNRRKRVAAYRKNANLDESFEITESNINNWAFTRTCTQFGCPKEKLMAELLKKPYTGLEKYDED